MSLKPAQLLIFVWIGLMGAGLANGAPTAPTTDAVIVEVRLLETSRREARPASTQPADLPISVPEDAKTLVTLLHLRDMAQKDETPFSIVSEMLDLRNRELAEATQVDDFIVSGTCSSPAGDFSSGASAVVVALPHAPTAAIATAVSARPKNPIEARRR